MSVLLPPDGSFVQGRAAVEAFYKLLTEEEAAEGEQLETETLFLKMVDGVVAYHGGRYKLMAAGEEQGRGRFLIAWQS